MRFGIFTNQAYIRDYSHILDNYDLQYKDGHYSIELKSLEDLVQLNKKLEYPLIIDDDTIEICDHIYHG